MTDFSMTPAIKDYVAKEMAHLNKFVNAGYEELPMCYIEIGKTTNHHNKGQFFKAEFTVHVGGKSFRAEACEEDLYVALDKVTEEMTEELKSFKDKKVSLIKRTGAKLKMFVKGFYTGK